MIPMFATVLLVYGTVGYIGRDYDMPLAVLSTLGLGLGIAIHFIQRFRALARDAAPPPITPKGEKGYGELPLAPVVRVDLVVDCCPSAIVLTAPVDRRGIMEVASVRGHSLFIEAEAWRSPRVQVGCLAADGIFVPHRRPRSPSSCAVLSPNSS